MKKMRINTAEWESGESSYEIMWEIKVFKWLGF
jgi:hypothetical protein